MVIFLITKNPAFGIDRQREPKNTIKPLSDKEIKNLLSLPDLRYFHGLRDRALMVLLLDTGMRISEAISLNKRDVFIEEANPSVIGKGNKKEGFILLIKQSAF